MVLEYLNSLITGETSKISKPPLNIIADLKLSFWGFSQIHPEEKINDDELLEDIPPISLICSRELQSIPWELFRNDVVIRTFSLEQIIQITPTRDSETSESLGGLAKLNNFAQTFKTYSKEERKKMMFNFLLFFESTHSDTQQLSQRFQSAKEIKFYELMQRKKAKSTNNLYI